MSEILNGNVTVEKSYIATERKKLKTIGHIALFMDHYPRIDERY